MIYVEMDDGLYYWQCADCGARVRQGTAEVYRGPRAIMDPTSFRVLCPHCAERRPLPEEVDLVNVAKPWAGQP